MLGVIPIGEQDKIRMVNFRKSVNVAPPQPATTNQYWNYSGQRYQNSETLVSMVHVHWKVL